MTAIASRQHACITLCLMVVGLRVIEGVIRLNKMAFTEIPGDLFQLHMASHDLVPSDYFNMDIRNTQCMVYLPAFKCTININQMQVNIPYIECLGMNVLQFSAWF